MVWSSTDYTCLEVIKIKSEILIQNGDMVFIPIVKEGINLETARKGVPGKLTFSILKDSILNIQEGNLVKLVIDSENIFKGYIFSKKHDSGDVINIVAYDQLRYLKNKDTYVYKNKTASEVVKMIATDFKLNIGIIEDTNLKIKSRIEDNKTLFDIIQSTLDITLQNKKKMYVLYDDFGKLTLKDVESMKLNLLINEELAENFDYTSSIDSNTYNRIKLAYNNKKSGKRDLYIVEDSSTIDAWGVLQYYETIDDNVNGKAKADALIQLYNKKSRNLKIKNAFGDTRVRGGSSILINLDLGDIKALNFMMVEKVKHTFKENHHTMDLTLVGGEFIE